MKVKRKLIFTLVLCISDLIVGISALNAETDIKYPVAKTIAEDYEDIIQKRPIDLKNPDNLKSEFEYDPVTDIYLMRTKIGDIEVVTPFSMTREQYLKYTMEQSLQEYFRQRNAEEIANEGKEETFSPFDMKFDIGPADKLFGPGGVQLQANGSVDLKAAITNTYAGDPTRSETNRSRTAFDFDMQIQAMVKAKVGDKINFDMNYNTQSTFDFDSKKLKLAYQGKEDEILKVLEAGNVSMTTSNSLINGGAALFGIRTEMQFGKLKVGAIFSQQESQSKTVSSKKGVQTTPFEITADAYEENQHFFLAHYFRDIYDKAMSTLPYIRSGISISRIEVWVTNSRQNFGEARNIVAFSDLAERKHISNQDFTNKIIDNDSIPYNRANSLWEKITGAEYLGVRDKNLVNRILSEKGLQSGTDYEKVENARRLNESEYTFNRQLGYISLRNKLYADEVLAVAFEFTYKGETYQVGELSNNNPENPEQCMYLKLLKGTNMSPHAPFWHLMMKNVYSLNTYSLQQDKFKLDILYQNDTTGMYLNYISEGNIANKLLLRVMNLDRLDSKNNPYSDGFFDYVEGFTVSSQTGRIIFPVVEPFGRHLAAAFKDTTIAKKYVFQELYDSTLTVARQTAEKNKFIMRGEYRGSGASTGDIDLGTYNVTRGSVRVTSNGQLLTEGVDYTVDYTGGKVTLSQHIADSGAPVSVSLENQSMYGMQRKTLSGLNLEYQFSPDFNIGATIMNLREMPVTMKVNMGEESVNNTIYGFNTSWKQESQWLTNMFDKLPLLNLTVPSRINFSAEFAQLIPGHYKGKFGGDYSYIDDFERAKITYDLRSPHAWFLASVPYDNRKNAKFPEASLIDKIEYGYHRALLAWYTIDPLFTRRRNNLTPAHIKSDLEQLSNHYVREITEMELFPSKDLAYNEPAMLPVLNLAYYPNERGPYNLNPNYNPDGTLQEPERKWGGIMRRIERSQTDFEASNIEYIEFWLLDPFIDNQEAKGGELYFNLGEISEDVLKDGKKFFENGLPVNGDTTAVDYTVWGKVPNRQSTVYAFDSDPGNRRLQDVGLNGLSTAEELEYPAYKTFLENLRNSDISTDVIKRMELDRFSPFKDPAGDNFHHYRGTDFDNERASILRRYKRFNGTEGNSIASEDSSEGFDIAAKITPDVEDINQDNTMNETERYWEYKVDISPDGLKRVGENYIVDKRTAVVRLRNDKDATVAWYQFKIPISAGEKVNGISDFKSIRFMRMYLTHFSDSVVLRFGTFDLVRGSWRTYTHDLSMSGTQPAKTGAINMSVVNIEENGTRTPVNYVLPPGVSRAIDPGQSQMRQQNEQAMSLKITDLERGDARAIYMASGLDTRQYKRLQMFVHAEKFIDDYTNLQDNELSVFLRMGSDYKNNYYEYEIPLKLTPPIVTGQYYSSYNRSDQLSVWPEENMFDFPFERLTDLKLKRNKERRKAGSSVTFSTPYTETDPDKPNNQITVVGNPTLSEVKVIMIGVRNRYGTTPKSGEIWVNELRVADFNEDGGWAANANLNVAVSDLGSVNLAGRMETAGFGSLEQGIMDRSIDDFYQYNISANVELGKLFPEKAKVSMPLYYTYSQQVTSSKYNPLDQDVLLKEALDVAASKAERDSIKSFSQDVITTKSISFNNIKVGIKSKNPMPWDPDNFNLSYSYAENTKHDPSVEYETNTDTRLGFGYGYSPFVPPYTPFKEMKSKSGSTKLLRDFSLNYLPNSLTFNTELSRNYYEIQLRDLNGLGGENVIPASFREEFYWNRGAAMQWNLTKNLKMSIQTGTQARIDTPNNRVNKENYDEYQTWKDAVWQSLRNLGTPLAYAQSFDATYDIPFRMIPVLDFMSAGLGYNAKYNWDKGAIIRGGYEEEEEEEDYIDVGNIITNERTFSINNINMNLLNLYNKSDFLKKANQKFTMKRPAAQTSQRRTAGPNAGNNNENESQPSKPEKKKFEGEIRLNPDSATLVTHKLNNKRLRITARNAIGKLYDVKFKAVDPNTIRISNKDSAALKLVITQLPPLEETSLYKIGQIVARGATMLRSVGFSYNLREELMLPNFIHNIGDAFGQGHTSAGMAPGLDFAFGLVGENYVQRAKDKGWLRSNSDDNITPAMFNVTETFNFKAALEPFVGCKVDLKAEYSTTDRKEMYFMYGDNNSMPQGLSGTYSITTVALGSAFENSKVDNNYYSKAFNAFLGNRHIVKNRLENIYAYRTYPNAGFISKLENFRGQAFDPAYGNLTLNSVDVLIPSFLAAYTNKNASKMSLSAFPSLTSILPNWKITYEGLMQLDFINQYFKNFLLSHDYTCRYMVGSYASYQSWVRATDDYGFIEDILTNNPTPSSPYDISAVSITETFGPLIGLNATFKNNMSIKMEMSNTRNLNLNISSYQIVESNTDAYTIGIGYKLTEFNKVLKMKPTGGTGFSNDLTVSAEFTYKKMLSLIRKIQDSFTQGTNGDSQTSIKITADYNLSKMLTVQAFFDRIMSRPLVSSTAYPYSKSSAGINLKLKLSR